MKVRLGAVIALFAVSCVISNHVPSAAGVDGQPPAPVASPSVAGDWSAFGLRDDPPPPTITAPAATLQIVESAIEEPRVVARELPPPTTYNPPPAELTIADRILAKLPAVFLRIAPCESIGGVRGITETMTVTRIDNVGPYGERGLFQIHPIHAAPGGAIERAGHSWDEMFDVEANIDVAAQLYRESGLSPWASSKKCWG